MKRKYAALVLIGLVALVSCTGAPPQSADMSNSLERDHPLAGKIWDVRTQTFISPDKLVSDLTRHDFIGLGEVHDNPGHHALQAWVLGALANRDHFPAVAFEMIGIDKAAALKLYQSKERYNADGLDVFLNWNTSGWPDWHFYKPIADTALLNGMPLVAANLPEDIAREMAKRGRVALPDDLKAQLALPAPIPAVLQQAMAQDIRDGHCNGLPERLIAPFVEVQFTRDAVMAMALADHANADGAVLIAGNGHVRNDRGVPWHLARIAAKKSFAALAMVEVAAGKTRPQDYAADWNTRRLPFDYVWFTSRQTRADPCAVFQPSKTARD